jgi:GNAT superfamily N-acetyltransferase/nucleotide-binding universal stress UspA family protein
VSLELRPTSVDEAPAIKALLEEHALASFGEPELSEEEVRSWFAQQNLVFRVAERDGELVGYLDIQLQESGRFPADVRTLDAEAAGLLLAEAEQIGRERGANVVRSFVQGGDPVMRPVLEEAAWRPIRYSFQMRIDLDRELPEPEWPDGLSPRNMRPGEEERVYEAHMDAFADHWEHHRYTFQDWHDFNIGRHSFDPSLWWLVDDGEELAAISLNTWHFSGDPQFGWIHVLGVRPPWRKRGLGTALLGPRRAAGRPGCRRREHDRRRAPL